LEEKTQEHNHMITTQEKRELLHEIAQDEPGLDSILGKILLLQRETYRLRLQRYDHDLSMFEQRYHMSSETFSTQFAQGSLGDAMDFFEWSGLIELRQDILRKMQRLDRI
jgi:hypothetical protein